MLNLTIIVLLLIMLLSSCNNQNITISDTTVSSSPTIENVVGEDTSNSKTTVTREEIITGFQNTEINYKYQLPEELKNLTWNTDKIVTKIDYDYFRNDENIYNNIPKEIVAKTENYVMTGDFEIHGISEVSDNEHIAWFGVMKYDMNSDGVLDYLIIGQVMRDEYISDKPGGIEHWNVYMLYITQNDGTYKAIKRDAFVDRANEYILDTQTNGINDLMVLSLCIIEDNDIVIKYNGEDSYSEIQYIDEKYFNNCEKYKDNIVKITLNMNYAAYRKSYIAIKYYDNPYLKENLLYCCNPDGTPYICDENHPTDIFSDGYVFYAELKDGVNISTALQNMNSRPTEIKYISIQ